jgi:carboxyl-terminal processing protease
MKALALLSAALFLTIASAFAQDAQIKAQEATAAYRAKEFLKGAQLFEEAWKLSPDESGLLFNGACSYALAGQKEDAFRLLDLLVSRGFTNVDLLARDTDLESLRSDARWASLIKTAQSNQEQAKRLWDNPVFQTPYQENLSEEEKIAGLSRVWSEVKYNFAYFDLVPELDWDGLYFEYLPKVRATKSTFDYYLLLSELMSKLRDGHTSVSFPNQLIDRLLARPAIETRLIEGKVIVLNATEEFRNQGITAGSEVVSVDGVPALQYAAERITPYVSYSTKQDHDARVYDFRMLMGALGSSVEVTVKSPDGKTASVKAKRLIERERLSLLSQPDEPFRFEKVGGNIAYVQLNTFNDDRATRAFWDAFPEISKCDALILDVRDNGGGSSSNGWNVLACLTDKPFSTSKWSTRSYRPTHMAWGRGEGTYSSAPGSFAPNGKLLFTKPVAVLVSPRTYSAAEDFTVAYVSMKRGLTIGEPTGGSTGQPLFRPLPGGGRMLICTKRDEFPDGRRFVGFGIQPDLVVAPTVGDLLAKRDAALERAIQELKKQAD